MVIGKAAHFDSLEHLRTEFRESAEFREHSSLGSNAISNRLLLRETRA